MKKLALVPVLLGAVVLGGCSQTKDVAVTVTQPTVVQAPAGDIVKLASNNYVPYSPTAATDAVAEGKEVAVFFHGKTCGSCAKLEADILANAGNIPEDMVILKADWDENQNLAAEYGVDSYHTVTVFNGDEITNVKALFTLDEVVSQFGS